MTEKEKAKAYDDAIERAKKLHDKIDVEEIFPELNESEDERIKKAIIEFFESEDDNTTYSLVRKKDIIAWLEKQGEQYPSQTNERAWLYLVSDVLTWKDGIGQYLDDPRVQELAKKLYSEYSQKLYNPSKNEQKSTDKIAPRFKVGDWVVYDNTIVYQVKKIEYIITIPSYELKNIDGDKLSIPFTLDYILKNWTIQDAKDGDVLALSWLEDKNLWAKIVIFKKYHSEGVKGLYYNMPCVEGYGITLKNGKTVFNEKIPYYSKTWTCNLHPATKEQRDLLFQKMKEAGYKWNTETNTFEKFYL